MSELTENQKEQRWNDDIKKIANGETVEVTEYMYDQMLNVLPPIAWKGSFFANSEPYSHNSKGQPEYYTFWQKDGKYYGKKQALTKEVLDKRSTLDF